MGLETGTYISDLVSTNPVSGDPKSQGDDHLRLLKSTVKATFPNVTGAVTPTHTELNYVDGVTSAIQTQLDAKAPLASPALTGVPTVPTATAGTNTTQAASTAFVVATSLNTNLPGQTGNGGKLITTDGTTASWTAVIDNAVVTPSTGTAFATTTGTQSLSNKSLTTPIVQDSADTTKKANFILSGITAGQNRNITVEDKNILLKTPGWVYLSTVTASASATVDIETTIDSTYDAYIVVFYGLILGDNTTLLLRLKKSGSYHSGASDYVWGYEEVGSTYNSNTAGDSSIMMQASVEGDADKPLNGTLWLYQPSRTDIKKRVKWDITSYQFSPARSALFFGSGSDISDNSAVTGIRFFASSGNINAGTFTLFGIRKT